MKKEIWGDTAVFLFTYISIIGCVIIIGKEIVYLIYACLK